MRRVQNSGVCSFLAASLVGLLLGACGQDTAPPALRNLDRPSEIAFACYGDLKVDGAIISSAQPLSSCAAHQAGTPPEGQDGIVAPTFFGFVLQPAEGTVAVLNVAAQGIQDNDLFTPGLNEIPVGTLPVGMAQDSSGCYVMTVNSGSCDLATIDATSALDLTSVAQVNRSAITTPGGAPLLARPRSIAAGPQIEEVGNLCPDAAQGLLYVTYPDCNLVAAIDSSNGEVQAGLVFSETGVVSLATEADYEACPVQCGDGSLAAARGEEPEEFVEKPASAEFSPDGTTLYVTSETSPFFTIVELDEDGLPTETLRRIRVAPDEDGNEVGLREFAVSGVIEMGGDVRDPIVRPQGEFQFAYAIATDSTIRVIDITNDQECDTQVDPRYLQDEDDLEFLACMPVGDLRTPPRRFGALGPGIELPGTLDELRVGPGLPALPLDIAFSSNPEPETLVEVGPDFLVGEFAFVTTASGRVFHINVDDDSYPDIVDESRPLQTLLSLGLPHQIRDNTLFRDDFSENCTAPVTATPAGTHMGGSPGQVISLGAIAASKVHEMPFFRGLRCEGDDGVSTLVNELSFAADIGLRASSFPDLRSTEDEVWSLAWEGQHSADSSNIAIDGPVVRKGIVSRDGGRLLLSDSGSPFCGLGIEPYDIVAMRGCNPLLNDAQCGVGEECYVHPETTAAVQSGVCLASESVDALSGTCREFLTARRRYSVSRSAHNELELVERRRMLRTTPLDGCTSNDQCSELALREPLLASDDHPIEAALPEPESVYDWVCEADPSRAPGIDRCLMACESADDCEDGFTCSGARCVEAALPPAECIAAVQRYQTFVGEAFVVRGSDSGFISDLVADSDTGECVRPDDANPLAVARIPLRPEPCDDDGDPFTGPNPCSTTVEHEEDYVPFTVENGSCVPQDIAPRLRDAPAVFFANPSMQFHLVDTETRGDLECRADKGGDGPAFGTPFAGYQINFEIVNGFNPKTLSALNQGPGAVSGGRTAALPTRITEGPSGNLWIMDQGDAGFDRGKVLRFNPQFAENGFDLTTFR